VGHLQLTSIQLVTTRDNLILKNDLITIAKTTRTKITNSVIKCSIICLLCVLHFTSCNYEYVLRWRSISPSASVKIYFIENISSHMRCVYRVIGIIQFCSSESVNGISRISPGFWSLPLNILFIYR
jgi:hypothetical protein